MGGLEGGDWCWRIGRGRMRIERGRMRHWAGGRGRYALFRKRRSRDRRRDWPMCRCRMSTGGEIRSGIEVTGVCLLERVRKVIAV